MCHQFLPEWPCGQDKNKIQSKAIRPPTNRRLMTARYALGLAFITVFLFTSSCGGPAAPLTVAAGGIAASKVLDKLEEKVTQIIQQAAAAGSLLSTKAARDLDLEI